MESRSKTGGDEDDDEEGQGDAEGDEAAEEGQDDDEKVAYEKGDERLSTRGRPHLEP